MSNTSEYTVHSDEEVEQSIDVVKGSVSVASKGRAKRSGADDAPTSRKRYTPLKPDELFVDWANDQLISHSRWGQDKLYRYLPVVEVDKLVGWATHMNSYQSVSTTNGGDHGDTTFPANGTALPKSNNNPLLGLPNLPLRPSLLKHLVHDPATQLALTKLNQSGASKNRKRPKSSDHFDRFHHSAAVAVGMLAEEMITASLLPLARRHVARCRQQENMADWTLPPEEAIYKLYQDSESSDNDPLPSSALLTARIPTRSTVPGAVGTSALNQPVPGVHAKSALDAWCLSRDVDAEMLRTDEGLFRLLVPMPNAPLPPPSATTAEPMVLNPSSSDAAVFEDSDHYVSYEI
jgi:hypothetical protein